MAGSIAVRGSSSGNQIESVLDQLAARDRNGELLTALHHFPAQEAKWESMPEWVSPELVAAYHGKGVQRLYSHQARAITAVHEKRNTVIVTPTASGKTLCYNLPVINKSSRIPTFEHSTSSPQKH